MLRNLINAAAQVKFGSVVNDLLADSTITLSKLVEGANLFKKDGSVAMTGNLDAGGNRIINGADAIADQDFVTLSQLHSAVSGLDTKESVVAATDANIDLATGGLLTIDTIALQDGDRVLVKSQTNAAENGIYIAASGAWTRAEDHNSTDNISEGNFVFVEEGPTFAGSGWVMSAPSDITLGTTDLTWTQFSQAGVLSAGAGLSKDGMVLNVNIGDGVTLTADAITIQASDSTISVGPAGIQVAANSLGDAHFGDGALSLAKLAKGADIILRDGTVAMTANLNLGGFKAVGMADGTADSDGANVGQMNSAIDGAITKWEHNIVPAGTKDGVNTTFTLPSTPLNKESIDFFYNGQLVDTDDLTLSGDDVTLPIAPASNDTIRASYRTQ